MTLFASALAGPLMAAQTDWSIVDSALVAGDSSYKLTLVPNNDPQLRMLRAIQVTLSTASPIVVYQASKEHPDLAAQGAMLKLDTSDKAEMAKLKDVLLAYEAYQTGVSAESTKEPQLFQEFARKAREYDGVLGEAVIRVTRPSSPGDQPEKLVFHESVVEFGPKDESQRNGLNVKTIAEPTALLYVMNHLEELRAKQTAAVEAKQKRALAEKALKEQSARDEVAKAKAVSEERLTLEETARQQKLADLEQEQKLQAVKDAEVEARKKKALEFLRSPEGKDLAQQIQTEYRKFVVQEQKEGGKLKPLQDRVDALTKTVSDPRLSTLDREIANEQLRQAVAAVAMAEEHEDSPELAKLRATVTTLLKKFELKSGLPYTDVMRLSQGAKTN